MSVLSVRDLTFATEGGTLRALSGVGFDIPARGITGFVGESGCGKSALIDAILGLLADNGTVAGGMKQRVAIAMALMMEPDLLIADEPTAGLDVSVQGEVLNLLADLRRRMGLSMPVITHDLHVVRRIADRMTVMYLGRFVETGTARQVFAAPRHPHTAALLSASPEPDPRRAATRITLPAEVPSLFARPPGCELHTRGPWARARCRTDPPETIVEDTRTFRCHYPLEPGAAPPPPPTPTPAKETP